MDAKFDFSAIVNDLAISRIEQEGKEGEDAAAIFRIFAKHGIGVAETVEIVLELSAILGTKE